MRGGHERWGGIASGFGEALFGILEAFSGARLPTYLPMCFREYAEGAWEIAPPLISFRFEGGETQWQK